MILIALKRCDRKGVIAREMAESLLWGWTDPPYLLLVAIIATDVGGAHLHELRHHSALRQAKGHRFMLIDGF